ncbi:hypothetical protein HK101_002646 [Irineochytrium annulatum]|nr:hypothetical protein HK101_002646 [Irineochytrium annulatum]
MVRQIDYPIVVNSGDTVQVTVVNNMNAATSIHWHGLRQVATPWYDGAGMVTQCSIPASSSFVYTFSTKGQQGTYWWHAHQASQYVDGLRGPFIIKDQKDPYLSQYDYDQTITLTDHHHSPAADLLTHYYTPNEGAFEPVPNSGLINGMGRYNCSFPGSVSTCKPNAPLYVLNFEPGKRYRLRLISTSAMSPFAFSIDGHEMTIIETDGVYTQPTVVNQIRIMSSQRYSVIVTANQPVANYWMRADIDLAMWLPGPIDYTGIDPAVKAIVRYQGAAVADPTTTATVDKPSNPYTLYELNGLTTLPAQFDQTLYFTYVIAPAGDQNITQATASVSDDAGLINIQDSQYLMPTYPSLLNLAQKKPLAASDNPVPVTNGTWVYLQVRNDDAVEHVFHLHGHTFWVINSGHILHRRDESHPNFVKRQAANPYPRRDSVQVPACTGGTGGGGENGCTLGFVGLLIYFDHPGTWLFHCHIEWHMSAGLAITFVNNAPLPAGLPQSIYGKCGTGK